MFLLERSQSTSADEHREVKVLIQRLLPQDETLFLCSHVTSASEQQLCVSADLFIWKRAAGQSSSACFESFAVCTVMCKSPQRVDQQEGPLKA